VKRELPLLLGQRDPTLDGNRLASAEHGRALRLERRHEPRKLGPQLLIDLRNVFFVRDIEPEKRRHHLEDVGKRLLLLSHLDEVRPLAPDRMRGVVTLQDFEFGDERHSNFLRLLAQAPKQAELVPSWVEVVSTFENRCISNLGPINGGHVLIFLFGDGKNSRELHVIVDRT
jgi:hypothetical protein